MAVFILMGVMFIGLMFTARRMLLTVVVYGSSMLPTYAPGDVLLARRWGRQRVSEGAVVILTGSTLEDTLHEQATRIANGEPFPASPRSEYLVKRLLAVEGDPVPSEKVPLLASFQDVTVPAGQVVVVGDNAATSVDSRVYGYLERRRLHAVVIRRIRRSDGEASAASPPATL